MNPRNSAVVWAVATRSPGDVPGSSVASRPGSARTAVSIAAAVSAPAEATTAINVATDASIHGWRTCSVHSRRARCSAAFTGRSAR